ncbi:MAG: glycosyl transferase family 2 [Methylibium sp. NZG]|nr:MAG: glycosyl transferase family 2 [Methylibium sp. NZG]
MTLRVVSVIVPCRNERGHIASFVAGVQRQQLPAGWALQLLIADGMSDDGTRDVLLPLSAAVARGDGSAPIQLIDNPNRIVSSALNAALARASGEVIVRMDVHTDYADDYIAQCIATLAETGADNVGGPWRAEPGPGAAAMQRAIAAAFQSRWVAGGAASRSLRFSGWADTVYLGCWPRATFERFGHFDESLVRNQDDEHNLRIVRGGGRVWQSARIRSTYRPRATLTQTARQYLQYGYWKPFVMKKHGQAASVRHLLPGLFVALLIVLGLVAAIGAPAWPLVALVALYALAVAALTATVAAERPPGGAALLCVPLVIGAYHLGYGLGSLLGAFDVLRGARGRERLSSLTR